MIEDREYDIVIIGSGAGGGTVAQEFGALATDRHAAFSWSSKVRDFDDSEFTGRELEMADALYEDGGGFLTADGTMTLAFGRAYGGSTVVYTGTSLIAPERVIDAWHVPVSTHDDIERRSRKFMAQNNVHQLTPELINDNNRLFVEGCRRSGWPAASFRSTSEAAAAPGSATSAARTRPRWARIASSCLTLKRSGVEVVTRAEALEVGDRTVTVRVSAEARRREGTAVRMDARHVPHPREHGRARGRSGRHVARSFFGRRSRARFRTSARSFTCHPAQILIAEHEHDDHERRRPSEELLSRPGRGRAVRARDVHVLPVRHREEHDRLRRCAQPVHAGVPDACR